MLVANFTISILSYFGAIYAREVTTRLEFTLSETTGTRQDTIPCCQPRETLMTEFKFALDRHLAVKWVKYFTLPALAGKWLGNGRNKLITAE